MYRKITLLLIFTSVFSANAQCFEKIMAGSGHSAGIKADGTIWGWGANTTGQNGNGNNGNTNSPVQTGSGSLWSDLPDGCNYAVTYSIKDDGTLWRWTNDSSPWMLQIGTENDWQALAIGGSHYIGLKNNGTLWQWGINTFGELGNGTSIDNFSPTQLGTDIWISIAAGTSHSVAIKSDGTLWAWGHNLFGEVGDGTYENRYFPVQIGSGNDWTEVQSGYYYTLAKKADGTLWSWGMNDDGQLGQGNINTYNHPSKIGIDTDWASFSAGAWTAGAIKNDGTLWTWGSNQDGILGDGTNTIGSTLPAIASSSTDWAVIDMGNFHGLALKTDGSLWAWGWNNLGQIGDGTNISRHAPVGINCPQLEAETFTANPFSIYPNPVKTILSITHPATISIDKITITDMTGKMVMEADARNTSVNVSQLQAGMYLLRIIAQGKTHPYKIIKE